MDTESAGAADKSSEPAAQPEKAAGSATEAQHDYRKHEFKPKSAPVEDNRNFLLRHYDKDYRKLLIIPLLVLIAAISILLYSNSVSGEFFQKDVSIKGGVTITILQNYDDLEGLQQFLSASTGTGVNVRKLSEAGAARGIVVEAGLQSDEEVSNLIALIQQKTGELSEDAYTVQVVGSALGSSFFRQMIKSILIAFVFMALAIFIYFRFAVGSWVVLPGFFVVWTVVFDIMCTLAVISLLKVEISTAGLAAFLLLIGYGVDNNILLTIRMLKGRDESLFNRIMSASRTGVFMTLTGLAAVAAGFMVSQSDTIRQIMLILMIGLVFDLISTYIGNTGVLRWYMERSRYGAR